MIGRRWLAAPLLALMGTLPIPDGARAATMASHCIALSNAVPGVRYAGLLGPDLASDEVRIHFTGHATFVIETAGGNTIATDFTGFVGPGVIPDVVTMNRAHSSHYTDSPDPRIPHVLRGWGTDGPGSVAEHRLELEDALIRNVTTDIRSFGGGRLDDQNSIFIFEIAGLCIGHLGHIHHEPTEQQYALMGRLDVVLAPVDGGLTLDLATMIRVMNRVRAQVVIPMHWFGTGTLEAFLAGMSDTFRIVRPEGSGITLSLRDLPSTPEVVVLMPSYIRADPADLPTTPSDP
ncbi:MAG: MBL fold metallo-hydrolase [Pseudomonadota bacterium]